MRSPLVITSVGFHIAVVAGFLVAGFWKLDRLDAERRPIDLAVAPQPPPAPSGGPAAAPSEPFKKKPRTVIKETVQPTKPDLEVKPAETSSEPGLGTGGTGSGAGSGSGTDPTGTGSCTGIGCGTPGPPAPQVPPPRAVVPTTISPPALKALRISGETQIHPPAPVKTAILRDGKAKVTAVVRVCISRTGEVTSVGVEKSSGYAGYDDTLRTTLGDWRYRAYTDPSGVPRPVCGMVTFIYSMQ